LLDVYQSFFRIYLYGWDRELAERFQAALPRIQSVTDVRMRSRVAWMQAAVLTLSGEYGSACRKAAGSRQSSRSAGAFFEYFAAMLFLNWANLHRGDLGQAIRVAKEGLQLAAKNGSALPVLWLSVRENWARMEAGEYERALSTYERLAAEAGPSAARFRAPIYLWPGLARFGLNDFEGAWIWLERAQAAADEGEVPFQLLYALMEARAKCALARNHTDVGRTVAQSLVDSAVKHHEPGYAARGYRILAEIASSE